MNLVWFLLVGSMLSILGGELLRFPFGDPSGLRLTDILLVLASSFYLIWQIGIVRKIEVSKSMRWVGLFWLVGLWSLIWNGRFEGVLYLIRFGLYSAMLAVTYSLVRSRVVSLTKIIDWFIGIGLFFVGLGLAQLLLFPNFDWLTLFGYDPHQYRLAGTFLDPNFAGCFLVLCSALAWWRFEFTRQRRFMISLAVFSVAIFLTFSRSAYLMWLVVWGVELWRNYRRWLVVLLVALIIMYLTIPRFNQRINGVVILDQSGSARFDSWRRGLVAFEAQPVFGVGFNNLRSFYQQENLIESYSSDGGNSGAGVDSSLLFILATTGLVGLVSYLIIPCWFLIKCFRTKYFRLLAIWFGALLVNSQFINSLFYPPVMLLTFILLGAIEGDYKTKADK